MAPAKDPDAQQPTVDDEAQLAQAYRDLLRGEQAATALEANLSNLEDKLDAILAAFEAAEQSKSSKENGDRKGPTAKDTEKPVEPDVKEEK